MSAPLWMPGALRVPSSRRITMTRTPDHSYLTWHTFECPYSWSIRQAAEYLVRQATEAFVFHPITGEWAQTQPMTTGARTLRAVGGQTNARGVIHQQVEVVGYARQPWTADLTPAGKAGLARGLAFFREWGIPDQWAVPGFSSPAYPGPGVTRRYPTRSGHYTHSGWPAGNTHGDPGAIIAPWIAAGGAPAPAPAPPVVKDVKPGSIWEVVGIKPADTDGGLVVRTDPGITKGTYGSPLPNGTRWHATGKVSGAWVEGRSQWMHDHKAPAMWVHGGYLDPVTPAGPSHRVTAKELNIRRGPGTSYATYGSTLQKGTGWYATGRVRDSWVEGRSPWMHQNDAPAAWVHGAYLEQVGVPAKPTPPTAPSWRRVTATAGLNVRTGPGTNYRIVATAKHGDRFRVSLVNGKPVIKDGWTKGRTDAMRDAGAPSGWVSSRYIGPWT